MNELSMAFDRMGVSTKAVIDAMNTKWNALGFYPGLVGGHCIGVDPYYFIYQAEMLGYHSQIIAAGRRVNDDMTDFITDNVIKKLIQADKNVKSANVYIMGVTFKENCPDMRNSKAIEVCRRLAAYGVEVKVTDPVVDQIEFKREIDAEIVTIHDIKDADCLMFLVAHQQFAALRPADLAKMFKPQTRQERHVIVDIKNMFEQKTLEQMGYSYWSL